MSLFHSGHFETLDHVSQMAFGSASVSMLRSVVHTVGFLPSAA
jgi:hypothetical protein